PDLAARQKGEVVEPSIDVVEPSIDVVEPSIDFAEPSIDFAEPLIDLVEPRVHGGFHLFEATVHRLEALLYGGQQLLQSAPCAPAAPIVVSVRHGLILPPANTLP